MLITRVSNIAPAVYGRTAGFTDNHDIEKVSGKVFLTIEIALG
jgi:hypothetical protein